LKMKSISVLFFTGLLSLLTLASAIAATPPSFAGNWTLNSTMSVLGTEFSLAPKTLQITQDANSLSLVRALDMMGQTTTMNAKYTLDGVECKNPGFMESQTVSKAQWNEEKTALVITSTTDMQGQPMKSVETYSMDNEHLKIVYSMDSPMGAFLETYVFDKQ
jgi:hypothetical protein